MKTVKAAIFSRLTGDSILMNKLAASPYMGRLPDTGKISKTKAALVINGFAERDRPDRETQAYTIDVFAYSHDLVEDVYEDVLRVLGVTEARRVWRPLTVASPAAKAFIRFDRSDDLPDPTSEVFHKSARFAVKVARIIS